MLTIEEMAIRDLPEKITGDGLEFWDENEEKRIGYIMGAKAVIKEIEFAMSLGSADHVSYNMVKSCVNQLKGVVRWKR